MSDLAAVEAIDAVDCRVVLRRVNGPQAKELFLHCAPIDQGASTADQARSLYRALGRLLEAEGGDATAVVAETLFLRDSDEHLGSVREVQRQVFASSASSPYRPATAAIRQPPLNEGAGLEVLIQAVLPNEGALAPDLVTAAAACDCPGCAQSHGVHFALGNESRFHAGGLCGSGDDAYEQTTAMFNRAEVLLAQAGMDFRDVVRTWIYLRDIDRDYDALNRARRAFFEARDLTPVPASTGIGGGPVSEGHDLCLGVYAVKSAPQLERSVMTSPTLNEAMQYGADFVRGVRVEEANKTALLVSGTASIDEAGRTAHVGDFDAQADRMLVNLAALLEGQGAGFAEVVSAVTYLKHRSDAAALRRKFREFDFEGFPQVFVEAPVCRPDLLCETEVMAVLPKPSRPRSGTLGR